MWGGIVGAFVWLYDYDFLLNVGGPETPISDSIINFFGVNYTSFIFFPLLFLVFVFGLLGLLIGLFYKTIFSPKEENSSSNIVH